jgi:chemotaxis protein MotB
MKTGKTEIPLESTYEPPVRHLFRKLETLERELESTVHTGHSRWMVPYADLLTLLLGLFLVLFASSKMELRKLNAEKKLLSKPAVTAAPLSKNSMKPVPDALPQKLKSALHMQGVVVKEQDRGVVISLKDSILFAPGSAELSPKAKQMLNRLSDQLRLAMDGKTRPIRVEGHTDNTPITTSRYPSNWELSTARATNIVRYLIAGKRLPADKLSAAGYGEFKPVAQNSSIEGKHKNRRVDIVVLNENTALQEPPAASPSIPTSGAVAKRPSPVHKILTIQEE